MTRPIIKICGVKTSAAIDAAAEAGATHIGFMFFERSPRFVTADLARALADAAPPSLARVAVLVDADDAAIDAAIAASRPHALQLHGHEPPERVMALKARTGLSVIKVLPVSTAADVEAAARFAAADMILFDAKPPPNADRPGGHGTAFDWSLLAAHRAAAPWILSGGLEPHSVAGAVLGTRAPGIDVSSGVESAPGVKDAAKIAAFCRAAHSAYAALSPVTA